MKLRLKKPLIIFDLETTGTSCYNDRIVEIAAVKVSGGKVIDEFSSLVNPEMSIPYFASQVNGITDEMVEDEPTICEVLPDFLEFIGDSVLVGHNIHTFDMKFVCRDCEAFMGRSLQNDTVDTLKLARMCVPELKHHRLGDLASFFGIPIVDEHRALGDCRMNQVVYERLGERLGSVEGKIRRCPKCGDILTKRNGKFGVFWGCSSYPDCRYTEDV